MSEACTTNENFLNPKLNKKNNNIKNRNLKLRLKSIAENVEKSK